MVIDSNTLFGKGPSSFTRLGLLGLLSVVLMTADHRLGYLETARSVLSIVVYPLQLTAELPRVIYDWASDSMSSRENLQDENRKLRASHLELEAHVQRYASLEAENKRLRELLQSTTHVDADFLISELISVDLDPYRHVVIVNKGKQDKVFIGQPALDSRGVIGQVIHTGPFSSEIMLITDPSHALPIRINRTGERTIAIGTGDMQRLKLPHLPANADIEKGDLLVTSGLGGRFPPGFPVGVITNIIRDPGESFSKVTARPTAFLERSQEALLVWKNKPITEAEPNQSKTNKKDQVSTQKSDANTPPPEKPNTPANTANEPSGATQ